MSKQAIARNTLKLAVLDFTESNSITDFSLAVSEELRVHMAVNNASLTIVDRAATERVIEEQRLSSSPLFDENKAASVGKLVSADAIVTGTLIRQGESWRLTVKLISVETGAVIGGHATWLQEKSNGVDMAMDAHEFPAEAKPNKLISMHSTAAAGMLWVNQAPASGLGIVLSRLKYKGDPKSSRFEKGNKGVSVGLNYYAGIPVKPTHDFTLGYRVIDNWTMPFSLNTTDVYQDNYFLIEENTEATLTIPNGFAPNATFNFFKANTIRVDRLRIDLSWQYSQFFNALRFYAETGLSFSKQFDRTDYTSGIATAEDGEVLSIQWDNSVRLADMPELYELKAAVGVERGRWGFHLEGSITTRNRNFMSPLDMFHHPEMTDWPSMQADLRDDGVGEITSKSRSEDWYYWVSSVFQLRYQL